MPAYPPQIEKRIAEFESMLFAGKNPAIADFLQGAEDTPQLLHELVLIDLELRLKAGEGVRLEHYQEQFPEIESAPEFLHQLIKTEYRVRCEFESGVNFREYVLRFPKQYTCLLEVSPAKTRGGTLPHENGSESDRSHRFRKDRLCHQGGLGNVWSGTDTELKRKVAVKEIKSKFSGHEQHQARFQREAFITGTLEHPGIVPIYGLGQFANGKPYYAMRYIDGKSLQEAINEYYEDPSNQASIHSLEFRRLLRHFLDVCNTIHYAHCRNVIHRDIKPSNIMLGDFGETIVVDWGLAKTLDSPSAVDHEQSAPLDQANNKSKFVGTPAFMSPEQANGEVNSVDIRSDVYGLGATLFSLLTNSPNPNSSWRKEKDACFELEQAQLPRGLRPLLAVCKKAMDAQPIERYQSAQELSQDIENFLADGNVAAHRETLWEKFSRTSRRHRAAVNIAFASLAVISTLAMLSAIWINSERARVVEANRNEIELRRKEVELRMEAKERQQDLSASIDVVTSVFSSQGACGYHPDMTMPEALEKMQEVALSLDSPTTSSIVLAITAANERGSGNYDQAIVDYKRSISLLDEILNEDDPLILKHRIALCGTLFDLGNSTEASPMLEEMLAICHKDATELEGHRLNLLSHKTRMLSRQDKHDEAMLLAIEAEELARNILNKNPNIDHRSHFWRVRRNVAILSAKLGKTEAAKEIYEELEQAIEKYNQTETLVAALIKMDLGIIYFKEHRNKGIDLMREAARVARISTGESHPDTLSFESQLAKHLSLVAQTDEERKAAIQLLESILEKQVKAYDEAHPKVLATVDNLAKAYILVKQYEKVVEVITPSLDAVKIKKATVSNKRLAALNWKLAMAYEGIDGLESAKSKLANKKKGEENEQ